ncbi:MAG TPA: zinc ribbon domain-containing protein [Candidatus Anaerobutyricum stercoris]|uniref:Zinc ribbon domain-containing protein n=1 Tax=Candidatus Anaerobutyricum stercoris TaxID=2838457 RepID=A0A9D2EMQ1_9FIRM|nr:zinc ribbon domain-containing protein [Candidatus Anaerobutyricum stercoris]
MFFIMGITQGRKDFNFNQMVICNHCGSYGRYQVYMTYMCLSLFFLPVFKWNKQYYVQMSCCHTLYALDPVIGKRIDRGEDIEILPEHLTEVQTGWRSRYKRCGNCGFETQEDYEYCPKCGRKF